MLVDGHAAEWGTVTDVSEMGGVFARMLDKVSGFHKDENGQTMVTPSRLRCVWLFHTLSDDSLKKIARMFLTVRRPI